MTTFRTDRIPVPSEELQGMVTAIERMVREKNVAAFVSTSLPDPKRHAFQLGVVTDLNSGNGVLAFSNASRWVRVDTGALL